MHFRTKVYHPTRDREITCFITECPGKDASPSQTGKRSPLVPWISMNCCPFRMRMFLKAHMHYWRSSSFSWSATSITRCAHWHAPTMAHKPALGYPCTQQLRLICLTQSTLTHLVPSSIEFGSFFRFRSLFSAPPFSSFFFFFFSSSSFVLLVRLHLHLLSLSLGLAFDGNTEQRDQEEPPGEDQPGSARLVPHCFPFFRSWLFSPSELNQGQSATFLGKVEESLTFTSKYLPN